MAAIAYHDTVNEVGESCFAGKGPFARRAWFALLEQAGHKPFLAVAQDGRDTVCLALTHGAHGLEVLTNWYAFTWRPSATFHASIGPFDALARDLLRQTDRIVFSKVPDEDGSVPDEDGSATLLAKAFRQAGWLVLREASDTNHYLPVQGRSFAEYLATRPGPLRTTLKRKAGKVQVRLSRSFDASDWGAYEAIYRQSWKPVEGDPALLRRFAEGESEAGHYLLGIASTDGVPVAAQFWTVEEGTAYIHKLAHLPQADKLSPGTTLTAALLAEVIDRDRVAEVDFGTGDDGYKADWMEATRPRYRLTCLRPGAPRNWPLLARHAIRKLVTPRSAG